MKYLFFILIMGCTATRKATVTYRIILDGTASKIINGNGKGYFKSFQWQQIQGTRFPIENPASVKTYTTVGPGNYAWELTGIDNLGNIGKDTFYFKN